MPQGYGKPPLKLSLSPLFSEAYASPVWGLHLVNASKLTSDFVAFFSIYLDLEFF